MKAKLELILRDENDNLLGQLASHDIDLPNPTLHEIEGAVEAWRKQALPELESQLLTQAQSEFSQQTKKTAI